MRTSRVVVVIAGVLVLAGCGRFGMGPRGDAAPGRKGAPARARKSEARVRRDAAWVPLRLSRESFKVADDRLRRKVRVGMARNAFLLAMKIGAGMGLEGGEDLAAGEGWFSDLSRRNRIGGVDFEEYSFGYYDRYRLKERFAVILRDGRVVRVVRSAWPEDYRPVRLPEDLTGFVMSFEEETKRIRDFYRRRLQDREAFERIRPQLKRVRAGWTSTELRLALGGSLYRLQHGPVYIQQGLLWGDGFMRRDNGTSSVVLLPFGYRTADGKVRAVVIVRAEGGIVTSVFWKEGGAAQGRSAAPAARRRARK